MIITRPIVQRLSPAIREASSRIEDGTLTVPSLFSFVGMPPEPIFRSGATGVNTSSFAIQQNGQVANAAQLIQTLCTMTPGWWRLQIQGSYRSNYVLGAATPGDFRILITDAVSNYQLVTKFAQVAGSQPIDVIVEFLIQNNVTISPILDANGAGQEHTFAVSAVGNRLL